MATFRNAGKANIVIAPVIEEIKAEELNEEPVVVEVTQLNEKELNKRSKRTSNKDNQFGGK